MIQLKSVSDRELLDQTRYLVSEERRLGIEILHRLREIESRQLHAHEGYGSLHEFAVQELQYSDGAAHRRIQAMRLLKELPEAEGRLKTGELTLTNASQLQDFFRAEKKLGKTYAPGEKSALLGELSGKSSREVHALLMERSPETIPKETLQPLNTEESKLTVVLSRELEEKLRKLKELLAHRLPGATYAELFDAMADLALQKLDPTLRKERPAPAPELSTAALSQTRAIPVQLKRLIWKRARGQCQYFANGRRCASRYALQIDHIHPFGKGGTKTEENLRLLCRTHNAHKNLRDYGFIYSSRLLSPAARK